MREMLLGTTDIHEVGQKSQFRCIDEFSIVSCKNASELNVAPEHMIKMAHKFEDKVYLLDLLVLVYGLQTT